MLFRRLTTTLKMTHRTYKFLRAVALINLCLLVLGLLRALVVNQTGVSRDRRHDCPCDTNNPDGTARDGSGGVALYNQEGESNLPLPRSIGQDTTNATFQVPNIVHYIWFNTAPRPLQFHHMLSVLSAHKTLDPDIIYFHTNMEPTGQYWEIVKALPKLKINYRDPPTTLFGEKVKDPYYYTSHSNVDRVKILMEFGGIYLDFDVLVTKPFDDLRKHVCTIGLEQDTQACGSVIICSKTSFFLYLWLNAYLDDYRIEEWAYNTGKVPFKMSRRYPHLVHVEATKLNRPNFKELDQIWGPNPFDWEKNYAVHLWYRLWKDTSPYYHGVEPNPQNVKNWNGSFGEMARSILYGSKQFLPLDLT